MSKPSHSRRFDNRSRSAPCMEIPPHRSGSKPRVKEIRRRLLHATHAKIQVVYDAQRARRPRPRLQRDTELDRAPQQPAQDAAVMAGSRLLRAMLTVAWAGGE